VIVVDTSALVAILRLDPERVRFLEILTAAEEVFLSAVTLYEISIVIFSRLGQAGLDELAALLDELGAEVVPFDRRQAMAALEAYRTFGKGIHPQASLNLGDCAAYALARTLDAPLLFKGDDFVATDIRSAAG
jgi:ribonuclease VapC